MARSWLEVTTDEVQSKQGAAERLAERRRGIAERAQQCVAELVAPALRKAGTDEYADREYREDHDTEWSVVRCGLYAPGEAERDPTVAFHSVEFDAYQPLVILRRKADGAGRRAESHTLRLEKLDADALADFLAHEP